MPILTQLLNTDTEDNVVYDICLPVYEPCAEMWETAYSLTNGEYRATLPCKLILSIEKQSVALNRLACLEHSNAKFIYHLDADVRMLDREWDVHLVDVMNLHTNCGLLGMRAINKSGAIYGKKDEIARVSMYGCSMFTRRVEGIAPDPQFIGSQWEDACLAEQYKAKGYDILLTGFKSLFHHSNGIQSQNEHNRLLFEKKWGNSNA